jgi:hypothetical protein
MTSGIGTKERRAVRLPGYVGFLIFLALVGAAVYFFIPIDHTTGGFFRDYATPSKTPRQPVIGAVCAAAALFSLKTMTVIRPNEALIMTRLGRYVGTVHHSGWQCVNPINNKTTISLRIRTLDSDVLKVNDIDGNPVEAGAMVVWQIAETAKAVFDVADYAQFVSLQTQAALQHTASRFAYDAHGQDRPSMSGNPDQVAAVLRDELQERLLTAGIRVVDVRLRRLAYAPEIAGAMLRRQQASAVVAARFKIVEGAIGMIDLALTRITDTGRVTMSEEQKASLAANLMIVLCGEQQAQPVINVS